MKLYYYKDHIGNFGDDLNPWLWPQLFPKPIDQYFDDQTLLVGIGSLLNHKLSDKHPTEKKIVFGSGYGYGNLPTVTDDWKFSCVRGPLTAQRLGLPAAAAVCDSAILVREIMEPAHKTEHKAAFMPHHITTRYDDWRRVCEALSIRYIDPADPVTDTLDAIRKSSLLITEAMHGAIIADAFRVPWIPVRTRPLIFDFKWQDWSRSLAMEHEFEWLPRVWNRAIDARYKQYLHPLALQVGHARLLWLMQFGKRRLSRDVVFQDVYNRLGETFNELVEKIT